MSDVPAPKSRFDEDGDWMARQFFSADELRLSPEEYAGRHADLCASFSLHLYRYRDKDLGKWARRVVAVALLGSTRFALCRAWQRLAFAADGKTIVFFGRDNIVGRWDAVSVKELSRVQLRRSSLRGTIISGDGAMLVPTSASEGLFVWDTATGKELRRLPAINGPNPLMAWLKDGRSLFLIDNQGVVHICHGTTGRELSRWPAR